MKDRLMYGLFVLVIMTIIMAITGQCSAQKTRTVDVAGNSTIKVLCTIYYNDDNKPSDSSYHMMGKDARYTALISYITLYSGEAEDLKMLLNKCLETFSEEDGTSINFNGSHIHVMKVMGMTTVLLYGVDDDSNGYVYITKNLINRLITGINKHISTK